MNELLAGIRLVSWDMDGTLYSSGALRRGLVMDCLRRSLREPWVWRDLRAALAWAKHIETWRGRPLDPTFRGGREALTARLERWFVRVLARLPPRAQALALLEEFHATGVTQVVLSDFECHEKTVALRLERYFAATYACEALGALKPLPQAFHAVQALHGIHPSEHLHIGDREDTDAAGARAAGARWLVI